MGRRAHGEGSLFQRADGRWVARLPRHLLPDGWDRAIPSVTATTKKQAALRLRELIVEWQHGVVDDLTLDEWLKLWVAGHPGKPRTVEVYDRARRLYITPHIGHLPLTAVARSHVRGLVRAMMDDGYKPSTLSIAVNTLSAAFNDALQEGRVAVNPAFRIKLPSSDPVRLPFKDREQAERFLAAADEHPYGPVFWCGITMGMRTGEVLGLTWDQLDLDDGLWVPPGVSEVKSQASTEPVPILGRTLERLRGQRLTLKRARLESPVRWPAHHDDLVFRILPGHRVRLASHGGPLDGRRVNEWLKRLLDECGLPARRFHDLRHSCGQVLHDQGEPLERIQRILRHSSLAVTNEVYVRPSTAGQREALERVWG